MDKSVKTFVDRVREAMEAKKINQTELARRLGVPPSNVSHYLTGKRNPGLKLIRRYEEALEVEPGFLGGSTQSSNTLVREPTPFEVAARLLEAYLPEGERREAALLILSCDDETFEGVVGGLRPFFGRTGEAENLGSG